MPPDPPPPPPLPTDSLLNCRDFSVDDSALQEAEQRRAQEAQAQAEKIKDFFAKKAARQYSTILGEGTPLLVKDIRSSTSLTAQITSIPQPADFSGLESFVGPAAASGSGEHTKNKTPSTIRSEESSPIAAMITFDSPGCAGAAGKHSRTMSFPTAAALFGHHHSLEKVLVECSSSPSRNKISSFARSGDSKKEINACSSGEGVEHANCCVECSSLLSSNVAATAAAPKIRIYNGPASQADYISLSVDKATLPQGPTAEVLVLQALQAFESRGTTLKVGRRSVSASIGSLHRMPSLFVTRLGQEQRLSSDDRPLQIQAKWLQELGYSEGGAGGGEETVWGSAISGLDFGFYFRFWIGGPSASVAAAAFPLHLRSNQMVEKEDFNICKRKSAGPSVSSLEGGGSASASEFDLQGLNLYSIPVWLLLLGKGLRGVWLGRNKMLDLSAEFCQSCDSLQNFGFAGNGIDSLPYNMSCFAKTLTFLDLGENCLREAGLETIGEFTELAYLSLRCNRLRSLPKSLACCKKLRILNVSSNFLQQFPDCILELQQIQDLDLSFNYISSLPESIADLPILERCNFTGNLLRSIPEQLLKLVRGLWDANLIQEHFLLPDQYPELISFSASRNPNLEKFCIGKGGTINSQLSCLKVEKCPLLSHFSIEFLLGDLQVLCLANCRLNHLSDDIFLFTPALVHLDLSGNFFCQLPTSLESLNHLETLLASSNQITQWTLACPLEKIKRLELQQNNLVILPHCLWGCLALESVNVSSNSLTSLPPPCEPCCLLKELLAAENKLLDESSVCDLFPSWSHSLELLNLSFNERMVHINSLGLLGKLKILSLSGIGLGSLPEDIGMLAALEELYADLNQITSVPYELGSCKRLKVVDLAFNRLKYNLCNSPFDWNWTLNGSLEHLEICQGNPHLTVPPVLRQCTVGSSSCSALKRTDFPWSPQTSSWISSSSASGVGMLGIAKTASSPNLESELAFDIESRAFALFSGDPSVTQWLSKNFLSIWKAILAASEQSFNHLEESCCHSAQSHDHPHHQSNYDHSIQIHLSALRKTFLECNRHLALEKPLESADQGASGIFLIQLNDHVFCANVGDSLGVLCRDGKAFLVSTDHRQCIWGNPHEIWRIKTAGGFITSSPQGGGDAKVCGVLELSKSFGFINHLPFSTASPSICDWKAEVERDEFVILASAALWNVIDYQLAVDIVWKWRDDLAVAAHRLRDYALGYHHHHHQQSSLLNSTNSLTVAIIGRMGLSASGPSSFSVSQGSGNKRNSSPCPSPSRLAAVGDVALARLDSEISPPMGSSVCIVFTDIKGSTRLWSAVPNSMKLALKIHNQILRRLLRTIGGYEVKTEGDSFMVVFPNAALGMKWCLLVQSELLVANWPSDLLQVEGAMEVHCPRSGALLYRGISVRMGIHIGSAHLELDPVTLRMDYFGLDVSIAARIRDLADGGQIFCSQAIYEAVGKGTCERQLVADESSRAINDESNKLIVESLNESNKLIVESLNQSNIIIDGESSFPIFIPIGIKALKGIPEGQAVYAVYAPFLASRHDWGAAIKKFPIQEEQRHRKVSTEIEVSSLSASNTSSPSNANTETPLPSIITIGNPNTTCNEGSLKFALQEVRQLAETCRFPLKDFSPDFIPSMEWISAMRERIAGWCNLTRNGHPEIVSLLKELGCEQMSLEEPEKLNAILKRLAVYFSSSDAEKMK